MIEARVTRGDLGPRGATADRRRVWLPRAGEQWRDEDRRGNLLGVLGRAVSADRVQCAPLITTPKRVCKAATTGQDWVSSAAGLLHLGLDPLTIGH
jgi:hypothetical protein